MILKYKLSNVVRKETKTGKTVFEATAKDHEGKEYGKVSLWQSDWPNFSGDESEIMAEMKFSENNGYKNVTLYPERTQGWGGGKKQPSISQTKIMEKQQTNIKELQDRKNDSIAFFNSTNCAISIVSTLAKDLTVEQTKEAIVMYRDFFLSEWHKYENDPTKGKSPF